MTQTVWLNLAGLVALLLALGCGESTNSNNGNPGGGGGTGTPSARHVTWDDNGVEVKGLVALGVRASSGMTDSLEVIGSNASEGIALAVTALQPLGPQTFTCNQTSNGQSVSVTTSGPDAGPELATQSCSVVLTEIGMAGGGRAVGTFVAVINLSDGGSKTITNGSFDVPVTN
jgi:hypothetical protein